MFCRRLGTALEAGIAVRTVFQRESERAQGAMKRRLRTVRNAVDQGCSLTEAFGQTDDFFPLLFHAMLRMGEETGHLDRVLRQLADHYDNQLAMRRTFLAAITWPMFQLGAALFVVGFLIWIMGLIEQITGQSVDLLGFGLVGNRGLAVYVALLAAVGVFAYFLIRGIARGLLWTKIIQRLALRIPVLGPSLQTLALSRMAWSMHLTTDTGMDIRRCLRLSLLAAQNARYADQIPAVDAMILQGHSLQETFRGVGGYPNEFLDVLAVGEESGKVSESMGHLARQFQERARAALAALTLLAGWVVWAMIAAMIVLLIFRIFSFYLNALGGAGRM